MADGTLLIQDDAAVVAALRAGDEGAYARLIDRYHSSLVRLARTYVRDPAIAAEVAQDAWIGLFENLPRFEGRSSLKTWLFRILVNVARTRARKEQRSLPFSAAFSRTAGAMWTRVAGDREPSVDPERFLANGAWASPPRAWSESPEASAIAGETRARVLAAVESLPENQRQVITLRDVEGWAPDEVCNLLGLSDTNQRVLLHRARSKVRRALDQYLDEGAS